MDVEMVQNICHSFPYTTEEIKWKSDLVFMIATKMFCLIDLEAVPTSIAFKVAADDFDEISSQPYFKPAPYFAQHKWVTLTDIEKTSLPELTKYLGISYALVKGKLSNKVLKELISGDLG